MSEVQVFHVNIYELLSFVKIYVNLCFIWKGGEMMGQITIYLDSETEKKRIGIRNLPYTLRHLDERGFAINR